MLYKTHAAIGQLKRVTKMRLANAVAMTLIIVVFAAIEFTVFAIATDDGKSPKIELSAELSRLAAN